MAWLDGRPIDLRSFGTSDRTLVAFPPADLKDVTLHAQAPDNATIAVALDIHHDR